MINYCSTQRQKTQNRINEIEYRRIKEAIREFKEKFNNQLILDAETLEDVVYQLDNQMQNTLEEVAPLTTEKRSKHNNKPWCNKQLNDQRKILKNREGKWLKYKTQDLWLSYKRKQNRYSTIHRLKRQSLFTPIEENSKDT